MIKKQNFAVVATICDPRFNFNVFQNLYQDTLNANTHKIQIWKQFTDTFVKYQHREKAIQETVAVAEANTGEDEVAIQLDSDSELDLFKPRGVLEFEAEYLFAGE